MKRLGTRFFVLRSVIKYRLIWVVSTRNARAVSAVEREDAHGGRAAFDGDFAEVARRITFVGGTQRGLAHQQVGAEIARGGFDAFGEVHAVRR